jgi:WD40 repeat protein
VELRDAASGRLVRSFKPPEVALTCVAYSPDSKKLVGGTTSGTLLVLDAETGRELLPINAHPDGRVVSVAWSPDGQVMASTSVGPENKAVKLWNAESGRELRRLQLEKAGRRWAAFSPDGKRIACTDGNGVRVWDVASGEQLPLAIEEPGNVLTVAFTPDGTRLIVGGFRSLKIWDASDGRLLKPLKGHSQSVDHVAVTRDGRRIVSGGGTGGGPGAPADNNIRVWDADSGQEVLTLPGHAGGIFGLAISPDGMRIYSASAHEKKLVLWDATPREPAPAAHPDGPGKAP